MIVIYLMVFALLLFAIFLLFNIQFKDFFNLIEKKNKTTLKEDIDVLTGHMPKGFLKKQYIELEQILISTGRSGKFNFIKKLSVVLIFAGAVIAFALNNYYLIPIFAIGFGLAPLWYLRSSSVKYKRKLTNDLETALSIITTSYLRTDDICKAVNENLQYMNEPIKSNFKSFLTEVNYINANIISALNSLKLKFPNAIFHEWIDIVIQCQSDRSLKTLLIDTIKKFSDVKIVQSELDTLISAPKKEAITMIFLVLSNIPLLYLLNVDWFHSLIYTTQGKIALAVCAAIILFSLSQIIRLSKPIEYKE